MWRYLTSVRLAIWLISLLTIEMGIAMFIPQAEISSPQFKAWALEFQGLMPLVKFLNLNEFFLTPLFLTTVSLFWLNTFSCTLMQFKRAWGNYKKLNIKQKGKELLNIKINQDEIKTTIQVIKRILAASPFKTKLSKDEKQAVFIADRNKWGIWGMTIFHIALLWIILGAGWGVLNKTDGNTFVVEGNSFTEEHRNYTTLNEGPLFTENHTGFEVLIQQVELKYNGKLAPNLARVFLAIRDAGHEVLQRSLTPEQMIDYKGYKIKLNRRGYTPVIKVENGGVPGFNLVSLGVRKELNGGETYGQKMFITDLQKELDILFFPNPPDKNKQNLDYQINNPQLQLTYLDEQGRNKGATVGLNESIIIDGQKVTMVDAKSWVELIIYKIPGITQVYFGFALAILGLGLHYGLPYQKITFSISDDGELKVYTYAKLTLTGLNKQVIDMIKEITNTKAFEHKIRIREDEEIW